MFPDNPLILPDHPLGEDGKPSRIRIDVTANAKACEVAAVPGARRDDIQVSVDGNLVSIAVETKEEKKNGDRVLLKECRYGRSSRSFTLAQLVDASAVVVSAVVAKLGEGVLRLRLPSQNSAAARLIAIHYGRLSATRSVPTISKAFMKSDRTLKDDIEAELAWDRSINPASVGVSVRDGVVTLMGHIDTFAQKTAIEKAVQRVSGVQALAVELDVRLDPLHKRSDTDIAKAAHGALQWQTLVPRDSITVSVEKGWVKLTGEVDWEYQRACATNAIRGLTGVIGISNQVTLKARGQPADVSDRIRNALARQATRDAARISTAVAGDTVTLKGTVPSWWERSAAEIAAYSAPGIARVVNDLRVVNA